MGILENAIQHGLNQYVKHQGKKPKFLILSSDCYRTFKIELSSKMAVTDYKIKIASYHGMQIVEAKEIYGGGFKWSLGD